MLLKKRFIYNYKLILQEKRSGTERRMRKAFSFVRVASLIFFLIALLWVYAYLPEKVALYSNEMGNPMLYLPRSDFFYYLFAFFMLVNVMLFFLNRTLDNTPVTMGRGVFPNEVFKDKLLVWVEVLISFVNIFFAASVVFIGVFNNPTTFDLANFTYLSYVGNILMFGWLIYLFFILRYRKQQPAWYQLFKVCWFNSLLN